MASDKKRNDVKKTASTLNSKWLQNTLKSMGVAGTEMIKDMMPATSETISSAGQVAKDAIDTVKSTHIGADSLAKNIKNNSAIKMGQDFFKNALEDIKTGNLYNTEREQSFGDFGESDTDTDTLFGDMDDFSFDDEGDGPEVKVLNQEVNQGVGGAATIKAIERGTEYNVRATKATVDTMVSVASTSIMNVSKIGTEVISQLTNINSNLAALIEYNNTNMTKFIDASIGYYEQMSKPSSGNGYGNERIGADEIYGSNGGLNFSNYKEYVKANIKEYKDSSMVGNALNMVLENKDMILGGLVANPIGTVLKASMKAIVPQVTKNAIEALDKSMKDFIPVMLERIGTLDELEGPFSGVGAFLSKAFGVKTKRKEDFDLSKIEKGPMPYNGIANHTIIEIIPKYLRESNSYLREIAEAVTGKSNDQMMKNATGFDWETGKFKNLDEMRKNVYDEIEARSLSEFRNSKFGEKMASQRSLLKSSKDRENYDNALDQLYGAIEKHKGVIDFKNKDHMNEIMGGINASDSIKNLIESYIEHLQETSDEAIGNAIATKQRATRERNQAMKDVENSATERGLRQFVDNSSYDAYIKEKYSGHKGATIDSNRKGFDKVNVSVPSLLQGIQDTLNRGIYVQIKDKLGNKSSSPSASYSTTKSHTGRIRKLLGRRSTDTSPQTKDEFKTAFAEEANNEAEIDDMINNTDNLNVRERLGQSSAKRIGMFKGVLDGIMAGNADKAFDEFMNAMRDKFRQAGEFLSEHFFTPIKKHLFGEKNEDGYIEGGIFGGVNNRMKESFYSLRRMITGKGYIDAEGNRVEDANEEEMKNTVAGKLKGMLGGLKEGIQEKLFGKKATNEGEEDKEGLLPKAKRKIGNGVSSLLKGLTGWKHALFGGSDDEDEDPEKEGKKIFQNIKEKAKDTLPSALVGTMTGAVGGSMAGGLLGTLVGGPVGGAVLGLAGGIASRSEKFKDWLFGPEDKDGKRIGGVISEKVQDYVKENGKYLAGGAALGLGRAVLTGSSGGLLGTLVGGPLAGAILGMGSSMLIKSQMFQKFLFGDERTGQKGLVKTVKSWFGGLGRNKAGDPSGGKLAGMMGIGAAAGAITLGTLTNVGILGLSLGPAGPIGGALLGLGGAILAQKKNFKEWLFGKVDPETGEKREGIFGKFKNMLYGTVFLPMKNTAKDLGRRFKTFFYYDVLSKFNLIIEPIGKMMFGGLSKLTGKAINSVAGLGDVIKEDFLMPALEKARKMLAPVTAAVNTIAKGIYNVGTTIIKTPINLLYAITSPIAQAVGKTVKGVATTVAATVKYAVVKPIKNLVIKPLVGAVKLATTIITKPFEMISSAISFVTEKVSAFTKHVSVFLHNVGQDFKEWIFKKNPIARGIRAFGKKAKDFGARVQNTFKILVRPLTEFVTTALGEVKNHLLHGISKFFSALNPINWVKGIYHLITGGKKKDKDPNKMGYFRRAWFEAGQFGMKDAPEGLADNGTERQRRKALKEAKRHAREQVSYYAEDGTEYRQSKNGKYYQVFKPDGSTETIMASDLPDKSTLTKKVDGISGEDENDEKREFEKKRAKNIREIGKATGWQIIKDTAEGREIAKSMAAKKGKKIHIFEDIETEDAAQKMRNARLQEDTLDATEDIKDNTFESSGTLKRILDTITFGFTMSPEEKQKLREHKQVIKKKAAFLGGYDGEQQKEDAEEARKAAEELAAHQAATLESDGYASSKRKTKKKTDNKYSRIRKNIYSDNYTRHGFFGGFKAGINNLIGYYKGGLSQIWNKGEVPDELKEDTDAEVPKHATGTRYAKRGPAIVGENGAEVMYRNGASTGRIVGQNGPEVINLQGGEVIIPNDKIKGNPQGTEQSNLTDDNIMKTTDSRKLGLGERILRELLSIKNNTAIPAHQDITINGSEDSYDDYGDEYDTTNLRRLGHGIHSGFNGIINRLPGSGLVRKGTRFVGGTVMGAKTVVGAGGELFKMARGKSRKFRRGIRGSGQKLRNRVSSWFGSTSPSQDGSSSDSDSDDSGDPDGDPEDATIAGVKEAGHEEQQEKENLAQAEVSSLTAENRQEKIAEQEEIDNDNAREDAILESVNNLEEGQKNYSNLWSSIFGKKGLITGGLLMLAPLLIKFLKGFFGTIGIPIFNKLTEALGSLKDTFTSWWEGLKHDFKFGLENLGDNASVKDKAIENLKRGLSVYDKNGNVDHQTGARKKLRDKLVASKIAAFFGKNADGVIDEDSTVRGSNNLYNWGKNKLKGFFGKGKNATVGKETAENIASDAGATIDNTLGSYTNMLADSTYGFDFDQAAAGNNSFTGHNFTASKKVTDASVDAALDADNLAKMRESMWSDMSNNFTATRLSDDVLKNGVASNVDDVARAMAKEGSRTATEKAAATVGKETAENVVKNVGEKVLKEGGEAVTEKAATNESLWAKVTGMLKEAFTAIRDKVIKKSGGSKVAEAAVKSAPDDVMKQVGKCEKFFPKVSGKIASILGVTAGLGATVVGLAAKEGTWITIGALNGVTGAARLFRVDNPDSLMTIISGVIGGLLGTTVGSIIDVINELVVSVLGIDIVSQLATLIYSAIMRVSGNEEAAEALRNAQDEFQEKFEKDKSASLNKQYETMKSAGLIDSSVTSEQFMEGVKTGKYNAHVESFADYNDNQHQTFGAKMSKGMRGGMKELKKTFIGEKRTKYTDKKGNIYRQNDDGTFQVTSSEGKDLGFVSEDAIPKDADKTVDKTQGVFVKLGKSIVKFVTPFVKMLGAILPTLAGDAAYIVSGQPFELIKNQAKIDDSVPMAGIAKAISFIPKLTGFAPAVNFWVGKKLLSIFGTLLGKGMDVVSNVMGAYSDGINAVTSGDIKGLWTNKTKKESDGIFGAMSTAAGWSLKFGLTPVTFVSWVGHKLYEHMEDIGKGAAVIARDVISNSLALDRYIVSGDIVDMWSNNANVNENNPVGPLMKAISLGSKVALTPAVAVSWAGHAVANIMDKIPAATVGLFTDIWDNLKDISQFVYDGEPVKMWKADAPISEDNPLGFIAKAASVGAKMYATIPASVVALGRYVWDPIKSLGGKITVDWGKFKNASANAFNAGKKGDPSGVWDATLECQDGDIIAPFFHFGLGVSKLFSSLLAVVMWLPEKVKELVDKVEEKYYDAKEWIVDKWDWITGKKKDDDESSDENPNDNAKPTTTTKVKSSDEVGGKGEGPSNGATITNVNNIPSLPDSTYYSQNDPRWASKKFVQSDGTDDGATIGNTGCAPTTMAMAVSDITGSEVSPVTMAKLAQESGDRDDTGVNWNFVNDAASRYNIESNQVYSPSSSSIRTAVSRGEPVVLLGQSRTGSSNPVYTDSGHYVVANGFDTRGNVRINDPRGTDYSVSVPVDELAPETISMWTFKHRSNPIFPRRAKRSNRRLGGRGNEYLSWLQTDPRWANKKLGNSNDTMAKSGCAVTSVAILTVYSQSIVDSKYDPGYLCDYLNDNKGFDGSGNIIWGVAPGMTHAGRGDFKNCDKGDIVKTVAKLMSDGYFVTLCVDNGSHYVAVLTVDPSNNVIAMSDPAQNEITDLFTKYPASSCDSYHYFKGSESPVELSYIKSGLANNSSSIVNKAKSVIEPIQEVGSAFTKYAGAIFNAMLTGNWDIDWNSVFADEDTSTNSTDASISTSSSTSSGTSSASSVIDPKADNATNIWKYLIKQGLSPYGAAGLMGNWMVESGLKPNNLEDTHEQGGSHEIAPGYTDASYTASIDNGTYTRDRFMSDSSYYTDKEGYTAGAGYGLAQWTAGERKGALYDATVGQGLSIADLGGQLDFAMSELLNTDTGQYLLSSKDYSEAAKKVLYDYEMGGYTGSLSSESQRIREAQSIFNKFGATTKDTLAVTSNANNPTDASIAKIKNKYGQSPTYDKSTGKYYVYDKNGHKIWGTLKTLSGEEAKTDPVSMSQEIKKATGQTPKYDSVTKKYYIYDSSGSNGSKIYGSLEDLNKRYVKKTENSSSEVDDVLGTFKRLYGQTPKYAIGTGKYYIYDNNGHKIWYTAAQLGEMVNYKARKAYKSDYASIEKMKTNIKENGTEIMSYDVDNYYSANGNAQGGRQTLDLIQLAEKGDQDAVTELGRRAIGMSTWQGYKDWDGSAGSGERTKIDELAQAWIKSAALHGNITAGNSILNDVSYDTDSPWADTSILTDDEFATIQSKLHTFNNSANKDSMGRILGMTAGLAMMVGTPMFAGTEAGSKVGHAISKGGSYGIKGAGWLLSKATPKKFGGLKEGIANGSSKLSDKVGALSGSGVTNVAGMSAGLGLAGYSMLHSSKKLDSKAGYDYSGFDVDSYLDNGGSYGGYGQGPQFGGRGDGPSPTKVNGASYYSQNDPRWSNSKFVRSDGNDDGATIGNSGCGPTAMAMALSDATGQTIKPTETAKLAQLTGDRDDTGVNWNFINNAANYYGVSALQANNPSREFIESSLKTGSPVILSGQSDGDVNSPYTASGHYVVAVGQDNNGNAIINDPRGKKYSKSVSIDTLVNTTGSAWLIGSKNNSSQRVATSVNKKIYKKRGGKGGVTAKDVVTVAANEIGYLEKTSGTSNDQLNDKTGNANMGSSGSEKTKYYYDLGLGSGGYWCAAFVSWCIWTAANNDKSKANELLCGTVSASCNTIMNNFKSKNQWFTDSPQPGDLILFNWADSGDPLADHIGIVSSVDDQYVYDIEGNSENPNGDENGRPDGVFEHKYKLGDSEIMGYCRPAYDGTSNFNGLKTDATVSEDSSSEPADLFNKAGEAIFKAGYTGNWNIDWDSVLSGATVDRTSSTSSGTASNEAVTGKEIKVPKDVQSGITENYSNYEYLYPKWADSSNQRVIADAWNKQGRKQDKGIAMVDGKYLLALAPKFGTTGDLVKIKLEDGESFNAILGDAKGADAQSEWGHILGSSGGKADIIEWEACVGSDSATGRGFDGISLEGNWKGKYVDSITNGGSYMDKLKGGSGTGRKNKSHGGRGSGPSLKSSRYDTQYTNDNNTNTSQTVLFKGRNDSGMSIQQREVVQSRSSSYSDENLEKLMKEVISILGVISNNSGNLSLLKDIKSGLSGNNTIVSNTNTTNTTVNANGKTKSKQTKQAAARMSRNEEAARKIAFGR